MNAVKDNYAKKVGQVLRQLRKQKKLSQVELCKQKFPAEIICSEKQLRRIEKGYSTPTPVVLNQLLNALGVTHSEFFQLLEGQDILNFRRDFSAIWDLHFDNKHDEAKILLDTLKEKPYCNMSIPTIQQSILLCEVLSPDNASARLDILNTALRLTSPYVLEDSNELDFGFVKNNAFTLNEYRILKLIAIVFGDIKRYDVSILLLTAISTSLQNVKVDVDVRDRLLPNVYYNLSDELIDNEDYNYALEVCEKGLTFCENTKNLKMLPYLLFNKGESLLLTNRKTQALIAFKKSYDTFLTHGNKEGAIKTKKMLSEKYNISI